MLQFKYKPLLSKKEAVSPELLKLIGRLQSVKEIEGFRLVGGTALALQLGHRTSVDAETLIEKKKKNLGN